MQLVTRSVGFPSSECGCSESYHYVTAASIEVRHCYYYCPIENFCHSVDVDKVPRALSHAPNGGLYEGDVLKVGSRYSWRKHDMV